MNEYACLFSAMTLLHCARHICYVGRHVYVQCDDPPPSATTLLLRGQAHLCSVRRHSCIVLRHLYYVGKHVSIQYCTVPLGTYCVASLSFIVIGLYKQTFI